MGWKKKLKAKKTGEMDLTSHQWDIAAKKRKDVLFAKSGTTDQTGKTWLNLIIIRESTFM